MGADDGVGPPGLEAMLKRMAMLMDGELKRYEAARAKVGDATAADGKALVDAVSTIARTIEKIDGMLRTVRAEREAAERIAGARKADDGERDELARQIAVKLDRIVEARARRLVCQRVASGLADGWRVSDADIVPDADAGGDRGRDLRA